MSLTVARSNASLLACSPRSVSHSNKADPAMERILMATSQKRELLSDRQKAFAHLTPRGLVVNAMRVVAKQSATIVAEFMTDKLHVETANEELVVKGELTPSQADLKNEEWEDEEWDKRWEAFPKKCLNAYVRYHAVTMITRFYEAVASSTSSDVTLDRLTMDIFKSAKRSAEDNPRDNVQIARETYAQCLWANALVYLADYTVQQAIVAYGYYMYQQNRRRKQKAGQEVAEESSSAVVFSFSLTSSRLISSRVLSLWAGAIGGAIGSVLKPGWGTLMGFNMGDGMAFSMLEPSTTTTV
mmetsp:Transcript_10223/g.13343  ORF Transcript_10223/g.13343 Transcript_10223/m.13343 type:complete len:299 (-) Transcript_10223:159-1055(-)|eukprot:CAMPEP_0195287504 /NCGR_PEP_ID=MMETSP0707-20130614/4537_1 /TAXON_ID=33640 /ORGANISM="Asterionellopsis glacialis, Strain CCMP134" /LENGTH=298 /DNA_ID=CAMNT_0040347261 /DNA_START=36 /DNA_END=932 /DNA_ORIENTATION=-